MSETIRDAIDVAAVRRDTPGCDRVIHLNNAGSSLPPKAVTETMIDYLHAEAENGGYETKDGRERQISQTYISLATLIGAKPSEIAITDNATKGWDQAFYGFDFKPGDRVLTCKSEYGSNALAFLHRAKQIGIDVTVIDNDSKGQIDLNSLEKELADSRVKLVAINHVPTQSGLVNPAEEVGALTTAAGVPFLLDACQSVGHLNLDVQTLKCDVLTGTGRKYLRGPRGTGFMYVADSSMHKFQPAFIDNASATWISPTEYELKPDARRFETWEKSYAAVVGLGAAVDYALDLGMPAIESRIRHLAGYLRDGLAAISGLQQHDAGANPCGIVSFTIAGVAPEAIKLRLTTLQINTSVSRATSSQWDLPAKRLTSVVRVSVHYYNTTDELDRLIANLQDMTSESGAI
ncbi:MAG: aminotransferase class V-fold PLP-dependent enzyme [Homoserinimonas sp.]